MKKSHVDNCCLVHGCTYGQSYCPVVSGKHEQRLTACKICYRPPKRLATEEERQRFENMSKLWLKQSPFFEQHGFLPRLAIVEYIANQEGITLYPCHII